MKCLLVLVSYPKGESGEWRENIFHKFAPNKFILVLTTYKLKCGVKRT